MLYVRALPLGPMKNFVYLLGRADRPETAVIDPAWEPDTILAAARADGRTLTHALLTHRHHDHVNALPELLSTTDLRVVVHRDDAGSLPVDVPPSSRETTAAGDVIDVGGLGIRALHTPGHTPGSQTFQVATDGGALFSGDTLFVNACGRCDLQGGDPARMFDSLTRVLGALPDDTRLYPGHDYGDVPVSTLGRERACNPYLQPSTVVEFIARRMRPRMA
jgi:glyoxylase-like metal-dependent hydrolase (beta-lactamase superfamily II)